MFDNNYLGKVNNPDGLTGLYDQVPRNYRRVTRPPTERALSQRPRRCGRSSESSWLSSSN
eukprot:3612343-Pleurochrysis_carterae.AAC.1